MKRKFILLILISLWISPVFGQQEGAPVSGKVPLSGKNGLAIIGKHFGAERVQWIVEMHGFNGIPQPSEWSVVAYNAASPSLLTEYWVGEGRAVDEGPYTELYPDKAPIGYIEFTKLKLDSAAAFTVAEGVARNARVGFDSLNYVLRAREHTTEPVWILALLNVDKKLVGKVHVSGVTGSVLRTIWINRQGPIPTVIDSSAPGGKKPEGAELGPAGTTSKPKTGGQLYPSSIPKKGNVKIEERRVRSTDQ